MQRSRSRKQVLLLDCCYSGAFARGMITKADKKVITRNDFEGEGRGRVVLTASDAMQYSFEGDQVGGKGIPSVFTGNLVHGLKTGEADLKLTIRLCKDLKSFPNFNSYQHSVNEVVNLCKQNEGWLKSVRTGGQPESPFRSPK